MTVCFVVLAGWRERLVGLLGTRRTDLRARPVALVSCRSVHTFWMRYALDVALVASDGTVLGSWRGLPPGRLVWRAGASLALERPSGLAPWPREGERVVLRPQRWHVVAM